MQSLLVLDHLVHILKETCMVGAQSINTRRGGPAWYILLCSLRGAACALSIGSVILGSRDPVDSSLPALYLWAKGLVNPQTMNVCGGESSGVKCGHVACLRTLGSPADWVVHL